MIIILRKLSDVLKEYPNFEPRWKVIEKTLLEETKIVTGIENPNFGKVERVVICKEDGSPIYDQFLIKETPGAVIVPYIIKDKDVSVGLIGRVRETIIDPETGKGTYSVELPRGFSKMDETIESTVIRELGEETGKVAKNIEYLGQINHNTTFFNSYDQVFAVEVDPLIRSNLQPDSKEPILKCDFFPYSEVKGKIKENEIYCGITLSALNLFDSHLKNLI